jgi:hypothetical protein
MIVATKTKNGKTETRTFSPIAWKLLGSNKEGWVAVDSQPVVSNVKTKPDNGEKKKDEKPVVEKITSNLGEAKTENVESNLTEKSELAKLQEICVEKNIEFQTGDDEQTLKSLIEINEQSTNNQLADEQEKVKNDFMKEVSTISKGAIKDYFDKSNIKYDNKANAEELQAQIGVVFEYDLQALKLVF